MISKNICKFISAASGVSLEVHNFVCESNRETMAQPFTLPHHRAILITEGEGTLSFDSHTESVTHGSLVFAFGGEVMHGKGDECFQYTYISFSGDRSDELFKRFGINKRIRSFDGFEGLVPLWKDSLSRSSEENVDLAAESMLLYAISRLRSDTAERNDIINRVISITE